MHPYCMKVQEIALQPSISNANHRRSKQAQHVCFEIA